MKKLWLEHTIDYLGLHFVTISWTFLHLNFCTVIEISTMVLRVSLVILEFANLNSDLVTFIKSDWGIFETLKTLSAGVFACLEIKSAPNFRVVLTLSEHLMSRSSKDNQRVIVSGSRRRPLSLHTENNYHGMREPGKLFPRRCHEPPRVSPLCHAALIIPRSLRPQSSRHQHPDIIRHAV